MKNWKKTTVLLLIIAVVCSTAIVALAGCTGDYTIMHVSDTGNALDDNYNEAIWTAIKEYGDENNITTATISALGLEDKDFQRTIRKCVEDYNAKYIVLGSSKFRTILTEDFLNQYPDTTFIYFEDVSHSTNNETYTLLEKEWIDEDAGTYKVKVKYDEYSYPVADNVICVHFDQTALGYAAGYAAAQLGKNISFFGSSTTRPKTDANGYALGKNGNAINDETNPIQYETYTTKSMSKYFEGFKQGVAAYAGSKASEYKIQYSIERLDDSDLNKRETFDKMITNGVQVAFGAAGDSYNQKLRDICVENGVKFINADLDLTVAASSDTNLSDGSILRDYKGATKYILAALKSAEGADWKGSLITVNQAQDGINWTFGEGVSVNMDNITFVPTSAEVTATETIA